MDKGEKTPANLDDAKFALAELKIEGHGSPPKFSFDDEIKFSSGNEIYAHARVVGMNLDGEIELSYGYDGDISEDTLSKEDRVELADMMIKRWTLYRNTQTG